MFEQKTLASRVNLAGIGLHTGESVSVEIRPADADTGIFFVRSDLPGEPAVEASPENLASRPRRTALVKGKAEVETGEHLLAALFGAGVGNAEVRLDGPELPGLDGSALPYYEAVRRAGLRGQGCSAREVRLREPIVVKDQGASLIALAREEGLSIGYTLDYGKAQRDRLRACPQTQYLEVEITEEIFAKEIAPARTFVFEDEIARLREEGLGKGATTENTLVLGEHGVIGNQLRFQDEFVRHKILDLIGDLFLTGCRLHGHVLATKSGHSLNMKLARLIRENSGGLPAPEAAETKRGDAAAAAVPGKTGVLENRQIHEILPHRYPFLLVDRVLELVPGVRAVGLKNVTCTEPFFQGHFPLRPIMPGVLIIESLAQVGGVILSCRCTKENQAVFILSLDNVKFRRAVEPGDQLILEADLKMMKSRTARVEAKALVNGAVAAQAEIVYRLIDL